MSQLLKISLNVSATCYCHHYAQIHHSIDFNPILEFFMLELNGSLNIDKLIKESKTVSYQKFSD